MILMKEKNKFWTLMSFFVFIGTNALFGQLNLAYQSDFIGCSGTPSGYANLTVSGGDGNYSFNWSNGSINEDLLFVNAGSYTVVVNDGTGLVDSLTVLIEGPDPLALDETEMEFNCVDSAYIALNLLGGTPPYTINWSGGQSGIATSLPSGPFSVTIEDDNGCELIFNDVVPDSFYIDLIVFDESCNMECDGSIFTSVNGGSSPYTFDWLHGADSSNIYPLHSDTFEVTVTDGSGCVAFGTGIVDAPDAIEINFIADSLYCGQDPVLDVSLDVTGGVPPYSYYWSTGDTSSTVFDFPVDSLLYVVVFDSTGCYVQDTFQYFQFDSLFVQLDIDPDECGNGPDGIITTEVTGGQPPYTYNWSNSMTGNLLFNVAAGEYTVTVTDVNGCSGVATGEVALVNSPLEAFIVADPPSTCFAEDGLITVTASGGVGPYIFNWDDGAIGSVRTDLAQGIYTVTIVDMLNCPIVEVIDLNVYNAIDLDIVGDLSLCEEGDSVYLESVIGSGTPPYTYSWSNGLNTENIWVDTGGIYILEVEDSLGCFGRDFVEVYDGSDFIVELFTQDATCSSGFDGLAWVNVYGEQGDLEMLWSNGVSVSVNQGLEAGLYSITVLDDTDCPRVFDFEIFGSDPIVFDIEVENDICGTNGGGAISVNVDDPSVEIEWSTGSNEFSIENLVSGTYSFVLTDTFGCNIDSSVTVVTNDPLELFLDPIDIGCYNNIGFINSFVEGGQGPYTYSWNTGDTIPNIAVPVSGDYFVTVTDVNSCEAIAQVYVDDYPEIYVEFDVQNTSCGLSNGSIQSTVYGGFPPYTYTWSNGSDSSSITGLSPGEYFLLVTDANGCNSQNAGIITVEEGLDLTLSTSIINPSCEDSGNGSIEVFVSGGLAPYTYSWSMGLEGENFVDSLSAGSYTVTVCDSSGCCAEETVQLIDQELELVVEDTFIVSPCTGVSNGSISIDVTGGGTNSYLYNWNTGDTTAMVSNLGAGEYEVTVTDVSSACFEMFNFVLDPILEPIYEVDSENSCYEGASGSASVEVIAGEGPFEIDWSNGSEEFYNDMLASGYYSFELTYANECFVQDSVYVGENNPDECIIEIVQTVTDCESQDGIITFDSSDFVSFEWSTGAVSETLTDLPAGTYSLTATDIDGCVYVCEVELTSLNSIGDFIWFDEDGDGIQDADELDQSSDYPVNITLLDLNSNIISSVESNFGYYSFDGLPDGVYQIYVTHSDSLKFASQDQGADDSLDSDVDEDSGYSQLVTLSGGICYDDLDIGFVDPCIPLETPGTIGYDQTLCGFMNIPDELIELTPATGGTEPYEYVWMKSYANGSFTNGTWFPIANSNAPNYQPGPLSHTTYFVRCVRAAGCDQPFIESNVIEVFVDPDIVSNIIGPNYICINETLVLNAADNGPGASYEWYLNGTLLSVPSNSLSIVLTFGNTGLNEVELVVTRDDCTSYSTKQFYVIDNDSNCNTAPPGGGGNSGQGFYNGESDYETFTIIPNLISDDIAYLQLKNIELESIRAMYALDVNGKLFKIDYFKENLDSLFFETDGLQAGVYILNLELMDGSLLSKKFVIIQ
jgi:hypothetical protein